MSGLAIGGIGSGLMASDDASSTDVEALQTRVAQLEELVSQLSAREGEHWLTESRANEIRSLVQDVLADADSRASLLQGGPIAGWDKGFKIGSPDGNFLLQLEGQIQARFVWDNRNNSSDDDRWGFELRRTKIGFKGHVVDPSWKYNILGAFNRDTRSYLTGIEVDFDEDEVSTTSSSLTGPFELEDAYVEKVLNEQWYVRFGQFKMPFMQEELMSSRRQLVIERSLVSNAFSLVRSQGVEVGYKGDLFRVRGMYSDGARSANTSFATYDTEWALTGRVDVLIAGDWKQFDDFTSWRGEEFALLVGGAIHYQDGEYGTTASETETLSWTLDASAEFGGANLAAAVVGRSLDFAAPGMTDLDQIAFVLQSGFFVADDIEVYGRYEWGDDDMLGSDDLSLLTVGFNKYFSKHQLKWSTDIGFAFDSVESTWATTGAGWQTDADGEDGQMVVRSQFQLLF